MSNSQLPINNSQIIIYETVSGEPKLEVRVEDETVWLTQMQLCELFDKSKATVSEHIKHIFEEGELQEEVVVRNFRTTTPHGAISGKNTVQRGLIIQSTTYQAQ